MKTAGMMAAVVALSVGTLWAQWNAEARGGGTGVQSAGDSAADGLDTNDSIPVVRVSQLRGRVSLDRNTGAGFETVVPNVPVVEGNKLQTGDGFAEVQLEDGSTLRLAPESEIEFSKLTADKATVTVALGTLYVSVVHQPGSALTVGFREQTVAAEAGSHFRVDLGAATARLVVFSGTVRTAGTAGTAEVGEKKTVVYTPKSNDLTPKSNDLTPKTQGFAALGGLKVEDHAEKGAFDAWDRDEIKYALKYGGNGSGQGLASAYGSVDLNYYGAFFDDPECGRMWRPYLVNTSWDPYDTGLWLWSPMVDSYTWVSLYPWGWLPYHSGAWEVCGRRGWAWRPGRTFVPLRNPPARMMTLVKRPGRPGLPVRPGPPLPHPPPHPPRPVRQVIAVLVGKPVGTSLNQGKLTLRSASGGIGVVRGSIPLGKVSSEVAQRGSVTMHVGSHEASRVLGVPPGREARNVMVESWQQRAGAAGNNAGRGNDIRRGNDAGRGSNTARGFENARGSGGGNGGTARPANGSNNSARSFEGGRNSGGNNGGSRPSSGGGGNSGGSRPSGGGGGGGFSGGGGGSRSAAPPPAPAPAPSAPAGHR